MASESIQSVYATALRNTHALEQEALQAMERQVERLTDYPEVKQALTQHIEETKRQQERLETALSGLGESVSSVKEAVMGLMGSMAAMAHMPAQDEILKNTFANSAIEAYEIAAYTSLLTIAEAAGDHASIPAFRQSLAEEEAMAARIRSMADAITTKYLSLTTSGDAAQAST
ncbi:ferritin-like domain-containing protein [uncultured Paracoccus sp.]|uniref:ferritin-like domain-containing protein n=1 Tax=uncultured Paracoccus sp. TaxID=189685 RepID=UPI00263751F9|nr:ferritin-like domain-containing protein [uncultured Paracoccus sp.]